jgi:hypothetical protein
VLNGNKQGGSGSDARRRLQAQSAAEWTLGPTSLIDYRAVAGVQVETLQVSTFAGDCGVNKSSSTSG